MKGNNKGNAYLFIVLSDREMTLITQSECGQSVCRLSDRQSMHLTTCRFYFGDALGPLLHSLARVIIRETDGFEWSCLILPVQPLDNS